MQTNSGGSYTHAHLNPHLARVFGGAENITGYTARGIPFQQYTSHDYHVGQAPWSRQSNNTNGVPLQSVRMSDMWMTPHYG